MMFEYNREYFLHNCGGCQEYGKSRGKILNSILRASIDIAEIQPLHTILDIGCGRGELVCHAALRGCKAIGIDFSPAAIDISKKTILEFPEDIRKNVLFLRMNAGDMHFRTESFDRIFLTDIVEHLTDEEVDKVLQEVHLLLKAKGRVIIHTAPTMNYLRIGQHIRRLLYRVIGKRFLVSSVDIERREKGHINVQSKESLEKHLRLHFPVVKCWYQFCISGNVLKKVIDNTALRSYLALNLFAVGDKEEKLERVSSGARG